MKFIKYVFMSMAAGCLALCLFTNASAVTLPFQDITWADSSSIIGEKDGRFGIFTLEGKTCVPARYMGISLADHAGRFKLKSEDGMTGIWESGGWLLPCEYEEIWCSGDHAVLLQNGKYQLYSFETERILLETDTPLRFGAYLIPVDGMVGVQSAPKTYVYTQNHEAIQLYQVDGENLLTASEYQAHDIPRGFGYVSVENREGQCGVWSISDDALVLPCRYRNIKVLEDPAATEQNRSSLAIAAATLDGKAWSAIRLADGAEVLPARFSDIREVSGYLTAEADGEKLVFRADGTQVMRNSWSQADQTDGGPATNLLYAAGDYLFCVNEKAHATEVLHGNGDLVSGAGNGELAAFSPPFLKMTHTNGTIYSFGAKGYWMETDPTVEWVLNDEKTVCVCKKNGVPSRVLFSDGVEVTPPKEWTGSVDYFPWANSILYAGAGYTALQRTDGSFYINPNEYDAIKCVNDAGYMVGQKGGRFTVLDPYGEKLYSIGDITAAGPSKWAEKEVNAAIAAELVPPEQQTNYTSLCSRETFCDLLARTLEQRTGRQLQEITHEESAQNISFSDTDNTNVLGCAELGIVQGVGNGKFAPAAAIKRQEAAAMLLRAARVLGIASNREPVVFADEDAIAKYAKEAVATASAMESQDGKRVMEGKGQNHFAPNDVYTLEQSILTLYRLYRMK